MWWNPRRTNEAVRVFSGQLLQPRKGWVCGRGLRGRLCGSRAATEFVFCAQGVLQAEVDARSALAEGARHSPRRQLLGAVGWDLALVLVFLRALAAALC
jgi:hypothetical protein